MTVEWIIVTTHAAVRWHERTESPGVGPVVAWNESERREVSDLHGDEIRFHRGLEVLLVRQGNVLATVIDASTARESVRADVFGSEATKA